MEWILFVNGLAYLFLLGVYAFLPRLPFSRRRKRYLAFAFSTAPLLLALINLAAGIYISESFFVTGILLGAYVILIRSSIRRKLFGRRKQRAI